MIYNKVRNNNSYIISSSSTYRSANYLALICPGIFFLLRRGSPFLGEHRSNIEKHSQYDPLPYIEYDPLPSFNPSKKCPLAPVPVVVALSSLVLLYSVWGP